MATTRHRPKRGDGNPLVDGDDGTYAGPLGGAGKPASESGDLQSREFGVPQADLPGGKTHVVNPQAKPSKTVPEPLRPADAHKYHGVPPIDDGQYVTPPDAEDDDAAHAPKPRPVPKISDAVPVFMVQDPDNKRVRRETACFSVSVNNAEAAEPTRICNRDDNRIGVKILNEDSSTDIRISENRSELLIAAAQGTGPAGQGALIWHGTNSYTDIPTQGELFAITTSKTLKAILSVIITTEVDD